MVAIDEQPSFDAPDRAEGEAALVVDLSGFEGPLDLLLDLARRQKVDLARISILALAEQYLIFIAEARRLRLELAADYLVMAAWLAYLKSRLLLPEQKQEGEPEAAELAADLAERLARLEALRRAATLIGQRPRLNVDVFQRGMPQPVVVHHGAAWDVTLHDLISAYLDRRRHQAAARVSIARRTVWSLQEAREALERLVGHAIDWAPIDTFLTGYALDPSARRSARASAFAASLELAREGSIDLRQDKAFAPLFLRKRPPQMLEPVSA
ncbi:MAG: segregation/condensation protein A [Proteobacteria bacterium]|nr:segregation/condensation protein A [Pseudomonadota bacterium]